jgi:hypothetical protein
MWQFQQVPLAELVELNRMSQLRHRPIAEIDKLLGRDQGYVDPGSGGTRQRTEMKRSTPLVEQLRNFLVASGHADLLLAIASGVVAWVLVFVLRRLFS